MSAMRKADIARRIHQQAGISREKSAKVLDRILQILASSIRMGDPIAISGFGTFVVPRKLPRKGRNPRTGKALMISARRVVTFRPSALLRTAVTRTE